MRTLNQKMRKLLLLIIFSTTVFLTMNSCGEDFLYKEPQGVVATENLNTVEGVNLLLIGAYSLLDGAGSIGGWPGGHSYASSIRNWVWDTASDDAYKGTAQGDFETAGEVERYVAMATNELIEQKWYTVYDGVSRSNDALKALEIAKATIAAGDAAYLEGQARFLRGFFHFRLQRMHYQVPYISHGEDVIPELVPNNHEIWDEIEADLAFAIANLPDAKAGEPGRATKWAASAVKAYVHLHQQEYAEAKTLLDAIIGSGRFSLVDNYTDNYKALTENNSESLFEVQSAVNDGTNRGYNGNADSWVTNPYNPTTPTCCAMYQPSNDLVNAYKTDANGLPLLGINGPKYNDANMAHDQSLPSDQDFTPETGNLDPRLDHTVGRRGIPYLDWGVHYGATFIRSQENGGPYYTKKQMFSQAERSVASHASFSRASGINNRTYRYSHILLWRAEVAVEEGDLTKAMELVNQIRSRASNEVVMGKVSNTNFAPGFTEAVDMTQPAANYLVSAYTSFPDQAYARAAVRMELRLETALEGNRFFDLRRWGMLNEVLPTYIQKEQQFRSVMTGAVFNLAKNDHWPIPQNQVDIQRGVLIQDPAY